jgi:hypothetical protein
MRRRAALGQQVEEGIGGGDAHRSQNVGAARE